MIYTHVAATGPVGVRSPLDIRVGWKYVIDAKADFYRYLFFYRQDAKDAKFQGKDIFNHRDTEY